MPRPGAPRPGNNPFASEQGMPRPQGRAPPGSASRWLRRCRWSPSQPRHDAGPPERRATGCARRGAPGRGGPGGAPGGRPGGGGGGGGFAGRPGGAVALPVAVAAASPVVPVAAAVAPVAAAARRARSAAVAVVRSAGARSKRAKRQEFEQMQAPSLGGVTVPRGDGKTVVRVRRGRQLPTADRIGANPASRSRAVPPRGDGAIRNERVRCT